MYFVVSKHNLEAANSVESPDSPRTGNNRRSCEPVKAKAWMLPRLDLSCCDDGDGGGPGAPTKPRTFGYRETLWASECLGHLGTMDWSMWHVERRQLSWSRLAMEKGTNTLKRSCCLSGAVYSEQLTTVQAAAASSRCLCVGQSKQRICVLCR
jgi:hypothetical protein